MQKNKYWKSLLGINAEALVAKAVAYTTDATFTLFQANAVEGEIGIYNAKTNALLDGLAAATAGTHLFIAQKRDGNVVTTTPFVMGTSDMKRTAYAAAVAQVSDAIFSGSPVAGKEYGVRVIETTPGYQQFPSWYYSVVAKSGETLVQLVTRIRDLVNSTTNITNKNTDPIVTCAIDTVDNLRFTANKTGITFRLAFSAAAIEDLGASFAAVTAPYVGSGTADLVKELEYFGDVFSGVTTQYPLQGTNPDDYGKPTAFAADGVNYHLYNITTDATEKSPLPMNQTQHRRHIVLAVPTAGGPETEVKAILGL